MRFFKTWLGFLLTALGVSSCQDSRGVELGPPGGEMFPGAQIFFDKGERPVTLTGLREHLQSTLGAECRLTEWRGFATVVPQLHVSVSTPFTLQIEDDSEAVSAQIEEWLEDSQGVLTKGQVAKLRRCNAVLVCIGASGQKPPEVRDGKILIVAGSSLDPSREDVRRAILEVSRFVDGFAYDLMQGIWILEK